MQASGDDPEASRWASGGDPDERASVAPHEAWPSPTTIAMLGMGGSGGDDDRVRRGLQGSAVRASFGDQLLRSGGLCEVLQQRPPPIFCLCLRLLFELILGFSLIMMYGVGIYVTFFSDLCFV
jgi:hypothetical protein